MAKTIHALIVGINAYPDQPLFGCVNDALAVGKFLKELCDKTEKKTGDKTEKLFNWNPVYLLAPHKDDKAVTVAVADDPATDGPCHHRRERAGQVARRDRWQQGDRVDE